MLRTALVFAVASWAAVVGGLAPATPRGLGLAALTVGLGLLAAWLVGRVLLRRAAPRARRVFDQALFGAALLVASLELGLRLAGAVLPAAPLWLPASSGVNAQLAAYRFASGSVRFGFPCNSLGYYDDEPPGPGDAAPWVACIGDSFVASSVPQPVHFTTVAERELGLAVQAFGVHAAGPREYLVLLERDVLPRAPDAVILGLFVGNDVSDSWRAETAWFLRVFHPKNARLLYVPRRLALADAAGPGHARSLRGRIEDGTIILDTPLGEVRGDAGQLRAMLPSITPWLFDRALEVPPYTADEHFEIERARTLLTCVPAGPDWPNFFGCLEALLAAAGTTPVMVLLLPDEFQVDDELWARIEGASGGQVFERDLPQRRISEFLRSRGVPCLDVLPDLRAAAARGEHAYLLRNTHFNLRGNEIVGHALAEFLARVLPGR